MHHFSQIYFFCQSVFWSLFNYCQKSQRNLEQCSLCCSSPCFCILLCSRYGPLQCFSICFRKSKKIGVLRPIFRDLFQRRYFEILYLANMLNFEKSGTKQKLRWKSVHHEPNLYSSGIKLVKYLHTPLKVPFLCTLVTNFPFSLFILISRTGRAPFFSASTENLVLCCLFIYIQKIMCKC